MRAALILRSASPYVVQPFNPGEILLNRSLSVAITIVVCIAATFCASEAAVSPNTAPTSVEITRGTTPDSSALACVGTAMGWRSRDEIEAFVASSPTDPDHVVAVWMLRSAKGPGGMQAASSRDGGRTWSPPVTLPLGACAGGSADAHYVSDPWLSIDGGERVYLSAIEWTPGQEDAPDSVSSLVVLASADGGETWPVRTEVSTRASTGATLDNTAIVADPDSVGLAWVTATRFYKGLGPAAVATTRDGGVSWTALRPVPVPGPDAPVALAPQPLLGIGSSRLWLVFGHDPRGANIAFVFSNDGGTTWSQPTPVDAWQRPRGWPTFPGSKDRIEIGADIVSAGIHRPTNTLWVAHQSVRPDSLPTIALMGSVDGGSSWATSHVLREEEVGWRPTLAVEPHGALAITWFRPDSLLAGDPSVTHPTAVELAWLRTNGEGEASVVSRQVVDRFYWVPRRTGNWFLGDFHGLAVVRGAALAVYSRPTPGGIRVRAVRVPFPEPDPVR